jgi:hypothetical protein
MVKQYASKEKYDLEKIFSRITANNRIMSPLRIVKNRKMPQKLKDSKKLKVMIINT